MGKPIAQSLRKLCCTEGLTFDSLTYIGSIKERYYRPTCLAVQAVHHRLGTPGRICVQASVRHDLEWRSSVSLACVCQSISGPVELAAC
jgi:hypothetical protein